MQINRKRAVLILEDGTVYRGYSFGAEGTAMGEAVFTTGVSGFQETLTDPANFGQIVVQTFPSVGGYGVNDDDYASDSCHLRGYVVRDWTAAPSNYKMTGDIASFMAEHGVVGICGVDTRALTRKIRDNGAMNAAISTEILEPDAELMERIRACKIENAVQSVAVAEPIEFATEDEKYRIAMLDLGHRNATVAYLRTMGCSVKLFPPSAKPEELLAYNPTGIAVSGGPGDPCDCAQYLDTVRALMGSGRPVLGLGLGHQLMALAQGFKTKRMTHGHRGSNQAVKNLENDHVFVTTQNHGYEVDSASVSAGARVTQINVSDGGCEAIVYDSLPAISVQYAPESVVGERDIDAVFRAFEKLMNK